MQRLDLQNWLKVEGASQTAIDELKGAARFELPSAYIELLRYSNGGEGPMSAYGHFCLDRAEDAGSPTQIKLYPAGSYSAEMAALSFLRLT